ncbi:hypothetical protein DFH09DRAFT_1096050 [Mycena vulgaris]|nr:hypothetical protein DFH09DRAFT_1096050 [Mycena vulgaris]
MAKAQLPKKKTSPDPRLYTRSSTDEYCWYYRHPTDGAYGPDETTWAPPQTAPTSPGPQHSALPAPVPPSLQDAFPSHRETGNDRRSDRARGPYQRHRTPSPRPCYDRSPTGPSRARYGQESRGRDGYEDRRGGRERSRTAPMHAVAPAVRTAPPAPPTPTAHAGAFVTVPPPDLDSAPRDGRDHPIFPVDAEESEYAGTSDDSDDVVRRVAKHKKAEVLRLRRVEKNKKVLLAGTTPRVSQPRNIKVLGAWARVTEFGVGSGLVRSEGVAHIMSQQAVSARAYRLATTGSAAAPRRAMRDASPFKDDELTTGDDDVEVDGDLEMPSYVASYLGTAPPGNDGSFAPSSRSSALEAAAHFAEMNTPDWPRIRDSSGRTPSTTRAQPHVDDMRSHLRTEHLAPEMDGDTPSMLAKAQFTEQAVLMFSTSGMYEHHVVVAKLHFAEIPIHGPYDPEALMTFTQLAACNKISDLDNTTFASWPHDASSAAKVPAEDIIAAAASVAYESEDTVMEPVIS